MAAVAAEAVVPGKANGAGAGCCVAKGPGYATPREAMEKGPPEGLLYLTCVYNDVRDGGEGDGVPGRAFQPVLQLSDEVKALFLKYFTGNDTRCRWWPLFMFRRELGKSNACWI